MTGEPKGEDADMRVYCGRQEQGQVLALFAIGLFAIVAMVALVIDGETRMPTNASARTGLTQRRRQVPWSSPSD